MKANIFVVVFFCCMIPNRSCFFVCFFLVKWKQKTEKDRFFGNVIELKVLRVFLEGTEWH